MTANRGARVVAGLVRHGHFDRPENTASAHSLFPLSAKGRGQAKAAADEILSLCREHDLELDTHIEASNLLRAWETARILAGELEARTGSSMVVEERPEMIERGLGSCANLRFDEIEKLLAADPRLDPLPAGWRRIPDFRLPVPRAESLIEAGQRTAARIASSMADLAQQPDTTGRLRLFVAHGGCLRHAAVELGTLDSGRVARLSMDHAQTILVERSPQGKWRQIAGDWRERRTEAQT